MIRRIDRREIEECVDVIRQSFTTVASEFGITKENAPRYVAYATTVQILQQQYDEGRPMYAYFDEEEKIIGYFSIQLIRHQECELNNLCVLPQARHSGAGGRLANFALEKAKEFGCKKMSIGIVEENLVLKKWYQKLGFKHTGVKKFDFFPFTCGYMEIYL